MGDSGVNVQHVPNRPSDVMTEGVSCNENFIVFQPSED